MNDSAVDPDRSPRSLTSAISSDPRETDRAIALVAKALAHPVRVRILQMLLAGESCTCGEIVDALPLAQATVSQHLKVLKDAGLVKGAIDGPRVCYCADRGRLRGFNQMLGTLAQVPVDSEMEVIR